MNEERMKLLAPRSPMQAMLQVRQLEEFEGSEFLTDGELIDKLVRHRLYGNSIDAGWPGIIDAYRHRYPDAVAYWIPKGVIGAPCFGFRFGAAGGDYISF